MGLLIVVSSLALAVVAPAPTSAGNHVAHSAKKCKKKHGKKKCRKHKTAPAPVPVPISLTITPSVYDFGSWTAGSSSPVHTFVITNNGYTPSKISLSLTGVSGIFVFSGGGNCNTPVLPGHSCQTGLRFAAQGNQVWEATLKAFAPDAYGISGAATLRGTSHP